VKKEGKSREIERVVVGEEEEIGSISILVVGFLKV
jgi:hypothetical protein